jgi:hypothetical protein
MAENLGWEFMSCALILLCAVYCTGVIQRGEERSKYISDRRKITKIEGKMTLKKRHIEGMMRCVHDSYCRVMNWSLK